MVSHLERAMESRRSAPYHRQLADGPTIVVKNGFLDEKGDEGAPTLPRTASAPGKLGLDWGSSKAEAGAETDVDSSSVCSFAESQSSPICEPAGAPPLDGPKEAAAAAKELEGDIEVEDCGEFSIAMTIESPGPNPCWSQETSRRPRDAPCGGPQDSSWLLPEPAWSLPPAAEAGQTEEGQAHDIGTPWATSSQMPWASSPQMSFRASPQLVAQMSPMGSPLLGPQMGSPQMRPQHVGSPQLHAQGNVNMQWMSWQVPSQVSSQHASPMQSNAASPLMSPLMSPKPSPKIQPQLSPDFLPIFCEADGHLNGLFTGQNPPPSAHTIIRAVSPITGVHRILWTVDAGKLRNHERQAVSPSFELPLMKPVVSRLVIFPKPNADGKGSASFKKSGGWGSVHLKCEASEGSVGFQISITDGSAAFQRQPRGPVKHSFAEHSTCGLPKEQEQWDFNRAVNTPNQTFAVCLDILPIPTIPN